MKEHVESLGRVRFQGVLLLLVVFVIGILSGAALERSRRALPGSPSPHPGDQRGPINGIPPALHHELGITADQDEQIRAVLDAHHPRVDEILDRFLPTLRREADSIRADVRAVLTPEQQKIFDARRPLFMPPVPGGARDGRQPPLRESDGSHPEGPPPGH